MNPYTVHFDDKHRVERQSTLSQTEKGHGINAQLLWPEGTVGYAAISAPETDEQLLTQTDQAKRQTSTTEAEPVKIDQPISTSMGAQRANSEAATPFRLRRS